MAFTFNGLIPKQITFLGQVVKRLEFNGVLVWQTVILQPEEIEEIIEVTKPDISTGELQIEVPEGIEASFYMDGETLVVDESYENVEFKINNSGELEVYY